MNNQKLKLPFAAITVLCWFLFTVYLIGSMIIKINDMGIPMDFLFENYGINWIPSIVSLLLLTLVLFSRTRSFMLPLAILIQLSTLSSYVYTFFINSNFTELLRYTSEDFVYGNTLYAVAFGVITIYAFLFSIICLSGKNKPLSIVFFIIYLILFVLYVGSNIICSVALQYTVESNIEMCLNLVSYFFLGIWIAFPYKYNKAAQANFPQYTYGANQQFNQSQYQNSQYNDSFNNQQQSSQQYNQYTQQNPQQFKQTAKYNYPASQSSFTQTENYNKPKTCPSCGAPLNDDDIYCGICGTKCN